MKSTLVTAALLIGLAPAAVAAEEAQTPVLTWQDCQDGFQCATAEVPLDYDQPRGTKQRAVTAEREHRIHFLWRDAIGAMPGDRQE